MPSDTAAILDHLGRSRPTVRCVRVIECAELLAADLFTAAEQNRCRLTFGDVQRRLAQLDSHPPD